MAKTVRAVVVRDFKDAGSETQYKAEAVVLLDEGVFENYRYAGLVRVADEAPAKAATGT